MVDDGWMALPFHRMPILNPRLTSAGFGLYCESQACAAGLNLLKVRKGKCLRARHRACRSSFRPMVARRVEIVRE